jgi:hypothetical protein
MVTRSYGAATVAALGVLISTSCDGELREGSAPTSTTWVVVEAFGAQSQALGGGVQRPVNPRAAAREVEASRFVSYLYDWDGLRMSASVSLGQAETTAGERLGDAAWQEPWISRLSPDALPHGSFDALQAGLKRHADARRALLARAPGSAPLCSVPDFEQANAALECVRALVCVFGYSRFAILVDPEAPGRTRLAPAGSQARSRFEPWQRFGHATAEDFCEAEAEAQAPDPGNGGSPS